MKTTDTETVMIEPFWTKQKREQNRRTFAPNLGGHHYPGLDASGAYVHGSECLYGCDCFMGGLSSYGPDGVDPFGECPVGHLPPDNPHVRLLKQTPPASTTPSKSTSKGAAALVVALLFLLGVGQSSSASPSSSSGSIDFAYAMHAAAWSSHSAAVPPSSMPGGGLGGGLPPLFPLSAMVQQVDSWVCDALIQAPARQGWDRMHQGTDRPENLLNFLAAQRARARRECSKASRDWLFGLRVDALQMSGAHAEALRLGLDSLRSRFYSPRSAAHSRAMPDAPPTRWRVTP